MEFSTTTVTTSISTFVTTPVTIGTSDERGGQMTNPNGTVVGVGRSGETQTRRRHQNAVDSHFHFHALTNSV